MVSQTPDPGQALAAVQEFTGLVRSGAYLAGSRAVRPKERSQWRFTFRRLLAESRAALAAPDPAAGEAALTEMIDLACRLRHYEYVRSQDPIEAAAVVVSDEIAVLDPQRVGSDLRAGERADRGADPDPERSRHLGDVHRALPAGPRRRGPTASATPGIIGSSGDTGSGQDAGGGVTTFSSSYADDYD